MRAVDAAVAVALGIAVVATTAAVAALRRRRAGPRGSSRDSTEGDAPIADDPGHPSEPGGPRLLAPTRIVVVGGPRASTGLLPAAGRALAPLASPRRRLLRDASAALFAIALVALGASVMTSGADHAGGVLSATAGLTGPAPAATPARAAAGSGSSPSSLRPSPPTAPGAVPVSSSSPSTEPAAEAPALIPPAPSRAQAPSPAPISSGAPVSTAPSASRLALLAPCPGRPGCYLYVVRRGDTLLRIATFFGIAPARILRLNPGITDPSVVIRGSTLVLPTPTR